MEGINNFSNGMNSDISKQIHSKDSYLQALNFRPLTELGGSNGSLVNIKGNECKVTFPDLQAVYKIIVTKGSLPDESSSNIVAITINGTTPISTFQLNNNTAGIDLYTYIISNYPACYKYTGTTIATKTFDISYEDNYIVIYQQPTYQDCTTVASIGTIITNTHLSTTDGTLALLYFVNSNNIVNSLIQDVSNPYVLSTASNYIIPIGSTFILDDIYILTAPDNPSLNYGPADVDGEIPANDEFKYTGAIWKLNIDDVTKQGTLTLVYYNNLDFTKYHPVPPSAITGRYESKEIQRIYWSDNYNKIRVLNTTVPQLMALNPNILNVMPKAELGQPILDSIGSGSLDAGCYQLSYRLSKVLGSITNYSELSNPVYLTTSSEVSLFKNYIGDLGLSNKSITWKLENLDLNFDQIEPVVIYRASSDAVPTITSLGLQQVTATMNILYSDATTTGYLDVSLDEFLLFNGTFTHAKTCDTKDNRLFWGNVRAPRKDLEGFDARAFRADSLGIIKLNNTGTNNNYTFTQAKALPQTEDCINEYYDSTGEYSTDACYLKPTDNTKLGGEGTNISYEFGTQSIQLDNDFTISTGDNYDIGSLPPGRQLRSTDTTNTPINLTYTYPQNNKFEALKQPERTSLLRGFQHEEIYRFAIQFFDREGNPYFSKWIGDIKMPSYGDTNDNPDSIASGAGISDFRLSFTTDYATQYSQVLYIKFTVDVTSIIDTISGYEIVRVKRINSDRTIWGCGMVNPFYSLNGSDLGSTAVIPASWNSDSTNYSTPGTGIIFGARYYTPWPNQYSVENLNLDNDNLFTPNFSRFKMFDCWDMDAGLRPSYSAGDKLLIRSRLKCVNYNKQGDHGYRAYFSSKGSNNVGADVPPNNARINDGTYGGTPPLFVTASNNDSGPGEPFFIMKMLDDVLYCNYTDFLISGLSHDYRIEEGIYMAGNTSTNFSGAVSSYSINNNGQDAHLNATGATNNPSGGKQTLALHLSPDPLYTSSAPYICTANDGEFKKLLALYYKPNPSLYGGATYVARSNNEYIPCGEYIPIIRNNIIQTTYLNYTVNTFGGDVFSLSYDMMKTFKGVGAEYKVYTYNPVGPFPFSGFADRQAKFSSSFFFPCTSSYNAELRTGIHINKDLVNDGGYSEDTYTYNTYCNAENDVKTYYPKPLNFQTSDEWINRIYWSEVKFNNETQDSWSVYLTDNFYDVEGNYGGINALVSLKDNMYYLQDRGVGSLMINPVSLITDTDGQPIKLGGGDAGGTGRVIQKHYYKSIDTGTVHQWSVYRSQSTITFVDARHKKIYLFNGDSVTPLSDIKGQRNFVIKRLHNDLLTFDNPVINKGILTTYDYYHNEFLYTFNNNDSNTSEDENLTLAYSEMSSEFTGMYNFTPNLYINSNKYLISTKAGTAYPNPHNKLWFHNYGVYGSFYGVTYPSTLKLIINDNPLNTKVFDNGVWNTESIKDNYEWSDDFNIYPGSITVPSYPDDVNQQYDTFTKVRCYNDYQNSDWITLTTTPPTNNLTRKERNWNIQIPRNKFNYDIIAPSIHSLFNPTYLTRILFAERMRDKYMIIDLYYPNTNNYRFIIHNFKTIYRISDR